MYLTKSELLPYKCKETRGWGHDTTESKENIILPLTEKKRISGIHTALMLVIAEGLTLFRS